MIFNTKILDMTFHDMFYATFKKIAPKKYEANRSKYAIARIKHLKWDRTFTLELPETETLAREKEFFERTGLSDVDLSKIYRILDFDYRWEYQDIFALAEILHECEIDLSSVSESKFAKIITNLLWGNTGFYWKDKDEDNLSMIKGFLLSLKAAGSAESLHVINIFESTGVLRNLYYKGINEKDMAFFHSIFLNSWLGEKVKEDLTVANMFLLRHAYGEEKIINFLQRCESEDYDFKGEAFPKFLAIWDTLDKDLPLEWSAKLL